MIDPDDHTLSRVRQCRLLNVNRSTYYLETSGETEHNVRLMNLIDEEYTAHPFYGSRRMAAWLCRQGFPVNRKRVQRLMREMGLEAIYPKPNLSKAHSDHKKYPYLLKDIEIVSPRQVWSTDITYIRLREGFRLLYSCY